MGKLRRAEKAIKTNSKKAKNIVVKTGSNIARNVSDLKRDLDYKSLNPIFESNLVDPGFKKPDMIRILKEDKKRENPVMAGAIGRMNNVKGISIMNIYPEYVSLLGAEFYPQIQDDEVFFSDYYHDGRFINLNNYFDYLSKEKVAELVNIAQCLGAIRFKVSLKHERKSFVNSNAKVSVGKKKGKLSGKESAEYKHASKGRDYSKIEVLSESEFKGHEPTVPELLYFKSDASIKSLIEKRMHVDNPLGKQTLTIKYDSTSSINTTNAANVDAALKFLKITGKHSIEQQAEEEDMLYIQYEIEFPE